MSDSTNNYPEFPEAEVEYTEVSIRDSAVKYVRTLVPYFVSWLIVWASTNVPMFAELYALAGPDAEQTIVGFVTFALGSLWYFLAMQLGKVWPWAERLMLGSARRPLYVDVTNADSGR